MQRGALPGRLMSIRVRGRRAGEDEAAPQPRASLTQYLLSADGGWHFHTMQICLAEAPSDGGAAEGHGRLEFVAGSVSREALQQQWEG